MNIIKILDFTQSPASSSADEPKGLDKNGHGTFVAGVLSSTHDECAGVAPDAELYILKLFTEDDVTYSSWFIDAFNWCMDNQIDIVNLSTASKDTADTPFIEKINEMTEAGIIVVSAIGNDGPTMGSVENPGDLPTVIGVGALTSYQNSVASFSSRGMTKRNLLAGVGFAKPDILLPGENVRGQSLYPHKCESKDGTSFSVPLMTGSIALALSQLDTEIGTDKRR